MDQFWVEIIPGSGSVLGGRQHIAVLVVTAGVLLVDHFNTLPSLAGRSTVSFPVDGSATPLGLAIAPMRQEHPGLSGVHPLADAHDAFAARVLLAKTATKTLDLRYYIWRSDLSGTLLFNAILEAADRGVQVRFLIDDNTTSGLDPSLSMLDSHRNVEVRLFNPLAIRTFRPLAYLTDFPRLNRRMHNKSFTADGQATIIGGRNVGDEYFGATDGVLFVDLDVLAVGPIVDQVSADFERYWDSESAYPAALLLGAAPERGPANDGARPPVAASPVIATYQETIRRSGFASQLQDRSLPLEWTSVAMLSDDPGKVLGRAGPETMVSQQLFGLIDQSSTSLDLVSPYFVPTAEGVQAMAALARRGVRIRVLTNSQSATDVLAVHAGYASYRHEMLAAGVELYELRRLAGMPVSARVAGMFGSSGSSLHAKTFATDGEQIFVGSFNFDPRSADLNTEMGFVIQSPALARQLGTAFDESILASAYQVALGPDGGLVWTERQAERTIRHDLEPSTTAWQRAIVRALSWLPIEWLL